MQKNVGGIDRLGRFVVGIVLAIAGIAALTGYWPVGSTIGGVALALSAVAVVTATTQKCPTNEALGIDTTE